MQSSDYWFDWWLSTDRSTIRAYNQHQGQLSLLSLWSRQIEYRHVWLGLRQSACTCVGWQMSGETSYIWQVTLLSFAMDCCSAGSADPADLVPNYNDVFFIIESICVTWFTIEFILRIVSSPSKFAFCKDIMNIFDVLAILPFFVVLIVQVGYQQCTWNNCSGVGV